MGFEVSRPPASSVALGAAHLAGSCQVGGGTRHLVDSLLTSLINRESRMFLRVFLSHLLFSSWEAHFLQQFLLILHRRRGCLIGEDQNRSPLLRPLEECTARTLCSRARGLGFHRARSLSRVPLSLRLSLVPCFVLRLAVFMKADGLTSSSAWDLSV